MLRIALLLLVVVLLSAVAVTRADSAPRRTITVKLIDSRFTPSALSLRRGDFLRFVWAGQRAHNLIGASVPRSYRAAKRRHPALTLPLKRKGTFLYLCSLHPGMTTSVRVR